MTKNKTRRALWQSAAIATAFAAGSVVVAPAAQALTSHYSPTDAVAYAVQYSCNENTSCRNNQYHSANNDCANFVSQALEAGGIQRTADWNVSPWTGTGSHDWISTGGLGAFLDQTGTWHSATSRIRDAVGPAPVGAVVQYDWGGGEGWSHTALLTGTGAYAHFYSSSLGGYYSTIVKNNYGDRITQHSTDRDGSPWELGYWTNATSWRDNARVRYMLPLTN